MISNFVYLEEPQLLVIGGQNPGRGGFISTYSISGDLKHTEFTNEEISDLAQLNDRSIGVSTIAKNDKSLGWEVYTFDSSFSIKAPSSVNEGDTFQVDVTLKTIK